MTQSRTSWLTKISMSVAGLALPKAKTLALPVVKNQRNLTEDSYPPITPQSNIMKPGAFSVSLNVKDLKTSKEFYEKLGFVLFDQHV